MTQLLTPFKWYDKYYKQDRFDPNGANNREFKLITDRTHLLPFQFTRPTSGYSISSWLLRSACTDAEKKLLTVQDSKFYTTNTWVNNGEWTFDCSIAKSGGDNEDELDMLGILTLGKKYRICFSVVDNKLAGTDYYLSFANGGTDIIATVMDIGYYEVEFVATSVDIEFIIHSGGSSITSDFIGITDIQVFEVFSALPEDIILDPTDLLLKNFGDVDYIVYCGGTLSGGIVIPEGDYYSIISDYNGNYFSEVITIKAFLPIKSPYYCLEWYNTCDIQDVLYDPPNAGCQYRNRLWLDEAVVTRPDYPFVEEGSQDGNQKFNATFQSLDKEISFIIAKCPEFIVDALNGIRLHDTIRLTYPVRKEQMQVDLAVSILSSQTEEAYIFDDYFANVTLKLLLDNKYVDSTCCTNNTPTDCRDCNYDANYFNELPEVDTIKYSLIFDFEDAPPGLYVYDPDSSLWSIMTIPDDSVICFEGDRYIFTEGNVFLIPSINSLTFSGGVYHLQGYAWPGSFIQVETSIDGHTWLPQFPIVNDAVFQLLGIDISETSLPYPGGSVVTFRINNFILNCNYGYSAIVKL